MTIHDAFTRYFDRTKEPLTYVQEMQLFEVHIVEKDSYKNLSNAELLELCWDNSHWTMDE